MRNVNAEMTALRGRRVRLDDAEGAFDRLFTKEYPKVVAIANRVLADQQEAEDVAQEVFISFHRLHPADADYAAPWLYSAASHRALNRIRDLKRRQQRELRHGESDQPRPADPEVLAEESERREIVRAALARVRGKYAHVLALRYSGLSYSEVAAAMRVNVGQVGTLLRRAEAELKKEVNRVTSE